MASGSPEHPGPFQAMFELLEADIVVFQECKIQRKDLKDDMVLVPGWDVHFSLPKHKKGYSGVAIYTKNATCCPIRAEEGVTGVLCPPNSTTPYRDLPPEEQIGGYPRPQQLESSLDEATLDSEGRCVVLEFPAFVLIGTYSPANRDETRDQFRLAYLRALDARVRNLVRAEKNVILLGDLNVTRNEMDYAGAADQLRKNNMTVEDLLATPARKLLNQLVFGGRAVGEGDQGQPALWDVTRLHHPDRLGMYTCWDTKTNARPGNFGSRIDYILCSDGIKDYFAFSNIQEGLLGSDHCPVFATLKEKVARNGKLVDIKDMMNPAGMFENGERKREWTAKCLLPLSGKLIPEFDRRRNIKDMFTRNANVSNGPKAAASAQKLEPAVGKAGCGERVSLLEASSESMARAKVAAMPKRRVESPGGARPAKKTKQTPTPTPTPHSGQPTIASFFRPKATAEVPKLPSLNTGPLDGGGEGEDAGGGGGGGGDGQTTSTAATGFQRPSPSRYPGPSTQSPSTARPNKIVDPIVSKDSWSKLLAKRVPPKCEHGEPCVSLVTKKAGPNKGRSFYMCARPLGPSGQKESETEWKCGTFIWSSDWTTGSESAASRAAPGSLPS
ncbi:uncharacterized protein MKZ38_010026 [Zalerion maritima]|uniref:DNA-(apurinic or apyrimidinic site) endonuclease 2 n=1 Tax=Zalerion maritima TaxID=339359 RepID=A0AAD5RSR2_9PEZI|nr:uncharacterized protein MKZ38_010026 [Zalerion maritima]